MMLQKLGRKTWLPLRKLLKLLWYLWILGMGLLDRVADYIARRPNYRWHDGYDNIKLFLFSIYGARDGFNEKTLLQERFRHATLLKGDSNTGVFVLILRTFKNTYFEEHLLAAASDFLSCSTRVSSCFCIDSFIKFKSFINRLLTGNLRFIMEILIHFT